VTQGRVHAPARIYLERKQPKARADAKPSAASNDSSRAPSTQHSKRSRP
jgi:hypothetical protein